MRELLRVSDDFLNRWAPCMDALRALNSPTANRALQAFDQYSSQPEELVGELARVMLTRLPKVRNVLAQSILSADPSLTIIVPMLDVADAELSEAAKYLIGNLPAGSVEAVPALIHGLASPTANSDTLASALARIGAPAVPSLVKLLSSERALPGAMRAIALIGVAAEAAIPSLAKVVSTAGADVALEAIRTLGKLGSNAVRDLTAILKYHPSEELRAEAATSLQSIGRDARASLPVLEARLSHSTGSEQSSVARAILSLAAEDSPEKGGIFQLWSDQDAVSRDPTPIECLSDALQGLSTDKRNWLLRELRDEGASRVQALVAILSNSRKDRAEFAEAWLAAVGEPAVDGLLRCLDSGGPASRRALTALGQIARDLRSRPRRTAWLPQDLENLQRKQFEREIEKEWSVLCRIDQALENAMPASDHSLETGDAFTPLLRAPEKPRYTDVEFFDGHLYAVDRDPETRTMADTTPLVSGHEYTLGVTIRAERVGVSAATQPPRAVRNTRADETNLNVYVVATPMASKLRIVEPLLQLVWKYNEDSETALFRFDVLESRHAEEDAIEIRLYDEKLDLLDIVIARVFVVPNQTDLPGTPRRLDWPDEAQPMIHSDRLAADRHMSIHVRKADGGYELEYLIRLKGSSVLRVPVRSRITVEDLNSLLSRVRNFWTRLVVTNYAKQLSVSKPTFERYLRELGELGMQAWTLLFGARYADQKGASESLGDLLQRMAWPAFGAIQITVGDQSADFIFPWALLYPPVDGCVAIDPLEFWGAKFCIEQVTRGPTSPKLGDEPVQVLFALDPSFENSAGHGVRLSEYVGRSDSRLCITGPVLTESELFAGLSQKPAPHLVYFFCHGYTASGQFFKPDGVQVLKRSIQEIAEGTPERKALETLLDLTSQMNDDSWVFIGGAQIPEQRMRRQAFFEERRPIVFLNMCQSADLLPSMSTGFVRLFLEKNASAVLGTESPMTSIFASAFAEHVFDSLFAGYDLGEALLLSRRYFLHPDVRNPLALAYTLYGRGVVKLGAGSLARPSRSADPTASID